MPFSNLVKQSRRSIGNKEWCQYYPSTDIAKEASIKTLVSYILNIPTAESTEDFKTLMVLFENLIYRLEIPYDDSEIDKEDGYKPEPVSVGSIFESYTEMNPLLVNIDYIHLYEEGKCSLFYKSMSRLLVPDNTEHNRTLVLLLEYIHSEYGADTLQAVLFPHTGRNKSEAITTILDNINRFGNFDTVFKIKLY